jgi:hypothetical protein
MPVVVVVVEGVGILQHHIFDWDWMILLLVNVVD